MKIIRLTSTLEAFGLTVDFLAQHPPFSDYSAKSLTSIIKLQLSEQQSLLATDDHQVFGYLGWLITEKQDALEWQNSNIALVNNKDALDPVAVLNIVVSNDRQATRRLIRGARELNRGVRVYFKREYPDKRAKKSSVHNF